MDIIKRASKVLIKNTVCPFNASKQEGVFSIHFDTRPNSIPLS